MNEKMKQFRNACRLYLSGLGIGDLRSYGREVGVARPTAKNKEDLIDCIVGILAGELEPIQISKQGAPVKNDRVDDRIPKKIAEIKAEYFANDIMLDLPPLDLKKRYREMLLSGSSVFSAHSSNSVDDEGSTSTAPLHGQVEIVDGRYFVVPEGEFDDITNICLPTPFVKKYDLREGDMLVFHYKKSKTGNAVEEILLINDEKRKNTFSRPYFERCFATLPEKRIQLCDERNYDDVSLKFIDWLFPLGMGQRACVVSSPKAGKTRLLQQIAAAASDINNGVQTYALLVDQSLETVRAFQKVMEEGTVFYSTYDDDAERQVFIAEFLMKRLKRMAETGKNVLLLVDSLNALARAFNDTDASSGGKTLSCGLESKTVKYIKKYFGTARSLEGAGSITILCAVNTETGSPFDDIICSEITSQANFEIRLNNGMAARHIYPALDLTMTSAKENEKLLDEKMEEINFYLRNELLSKIGGEGLLKLLEESSNHERFITKVERQNL